jgi:hypothetical protein
MEGERQCSQIQKVTERGRGEEIRRGEQKNEACRTGARGLRFAESGKRKEVPEKAKAKGSTSSSSTSSSSQVPAPRN